MSIVVTLDCAHITAGHNRHSHNMDVCAEIGSIAETNAGYSAVLSCLIAATGKSIEQLTIGELLQLHRDYRQQYNSALA